MLKHVLRIDEAGDSATFVVKTVVKTDKRVDVFVSSDCIMNMNTPGINPAHACTASLLGGRHFAVLLRIVVCDMMSLVFLVYTELWVESYMYDMKYHN